LILQLGYILHTVPAWKKAYKLRVLVFVEYESEVQEERGRLKKLLEKLRIDAEILVFWLASGSLSTYETIIHGHYKGPETERLVDECLKNEEWWEELQSYRGNHSMTESQEFASIAQVMGSTAGRPGLYNPNSDFSISRGRMMRRHSIAQLTELPLPRKPSMSQLRMLGVKPGIHTQNLPFNMDSSDTEIGLESDSDSDSSDTLSIDDERYDHNGVKQPLLVRRRRSFATIDEFERSRSPRREKKMKRSQTSSVATSYGTMSSDAVSNADSQAESSRTNSRRTSTFSQTPRGILKDRPTLPRNTSGIKFSSNLVPETTITNEDGAGPRIMFAETETRPLMSRSSSFARGPGGEVVLDKKVSFADTTPDTRSPARSRRSSVSKGSDSGGGGSSSGGDAAVDIPELLASYQLSGQSQGQGQDEDPSNSNNSITPGSSYSTQDLALSFNDLPPRAQHLILNELMRQNSAQTAVMFTTLPIPRENTCQSEEESLAYLSDVEVLCNGLPPVLMVLSNHMTVTVSL
jgi:potassium/chloride transporter 9